MNQDRIDIPLREGSALVLFEMLSREFDRPDYGGVGKLTTNAAEHWVLNELLGSLQKILTAPFDRDYTDQLRQATQEIEERCGQVP